MRIMAMAAWMLLIPALLITAFLPVAGSEAIYGALQDRHVDEAHTGVTAQERYALNAVLAAYIRGEREDLNVNATVYGKWQPAFNDTEILHMKDVRALFDLARSVRWACLIAGSALAAVPVWHRRKCVWHGFLTALGVYLAAGMALGLWAAADFTQAFTWFHEVLFANELWLLNPRTDLLIRMLPEAFFAEIAAAAVIAMGLLVALTGAAVWLIFGRKRRAE